MRHACTIVLLMTALACHAGPPAAPPAAAPAPPTLPRGYVPATRNAQDCGAVMARTVSLPLGDMDGLQRPVPRIIQLPPMTRGRNAEGRLVVTLRVNETGRPMRDSIFVTGAADPTYVREYVEGLRKNIYWPAVLEGCNVTARVSTNVDLGPRR